MSEVEVETVSPSAKLLLCRCRGCYLRHGAVTLRSPVELTIAFSCADCGDDLELVIAQRKGATFLSWRE